MLLSLLSHSPLQNAPSNRRRGVEVDFSWQIQAIRVRVHSLTTMTAPEASLHISRFLRILGDCVSRAHGTIQVNDINERAVLGQSLSRGSHWLK